MATRLVATCAVVLLIVAAFAATASAQQPSPGGPNAQVSEYFGTLAEIDRPGPAAKAPGVAGPGAPGEVGAAGKLPFTGLWILPLAMAGVAIVVGGLAVRRRRAVSPAAS